MAEQSNPGLKALLTGAVFGVASAAFGVVAYLDEVAAPETNVTASKGGESLTAEADAVKESLKRDRTIADKAPEGATINGQPRLAPLFFSTELWQITLDDQKKNTVVDIYDPASPSIHGDIPNTWFIAKTVYPEAFADVDMTAKTNEVTKAFLGAELAQEIFAYPSSFGGYGKIDTATFFG